MVLGDFTKVINAQNVLLSVGAQGEVVTLYNLRHMSESIIDRRNTRGGSIDTPTFTLDEIIADATISKALYQHFEGQRVLSSRGALPSESFTITGEAISTGADDVVITGNYILRRMEDIGQEQGRYEVTLTMRVTPVLT
jgi:hypothetical protein